MSSPAALDEGREAPSLFPDWCDPSPWLWTYVCEQYVSSPLWCTVFIIDGIALWIIACILWRQRQQEREARAARLSLPRAVRARRLWGGVAAVVRLVTLAAGGGKSAKWEQVWAKASTSRRDRRQYLVRRDFHLAGVLSRAAGPLLILGCSLLIWFEVDAYLTVGLPWFGLGPRARCAGRYLGFVVELRIFLDYARTAFSDPGRPEAEASRQPSGSQGAVCDLELANPGGPEVRQCRYCHVPKPPRCHHCKVCRRCVLKMDHHCPFVNNCVGLRNYRHFICFLIDLVAGCTLVALSLLPQVPAMVFSRNHTMARRVHAVVAFGVALVAAGALVPFLLFHLQLVALNKTSLELLGRRPPPSAAKGHGASDGGNSRGALENFAEVCGEPPTACVPCAEGLLLRLVPTHMARLAKRSE